MVRLVCQVFRSMCFSILGHRLQAHGMVLPSKALGIDLSNSSISTVWLLQGVAPMLLQEHGCSQPSRPWRFFPLLFDALLMTSATPNHALQRTAPRVTRAAAGRPAACAHPASAAFPQPARRAPQSLSLGSFGDFAHLL
jgi:hypothetical protein